MELKDLLSGVEKSASKKEKVLKSIGENFMALSGIARDLNVAGQNLAIVLEGRGVDPSKKQDAFFLKSDEREKKLEVDIGKDEGVTQVTGGKKKKSFFASLIDMLKPGKIFKILIGVLALGAIVTLAFTNFKDAIVEKFKDVGNMIKEKFMEFVKVIKEWLLETVSGLKDKAAVLYEKLTEGVGNFFQGVVEKVTSLFSEIANKFMGFISPVIDIFKSGYEKITGVFKSIKDGAKNIVKGVKSLGRKLFGGEDKGKKSETTRERKLREAAEIIAERKKKKETKEKLRKQIQERTKRFAKRGPHNDAHRKFRRKQATFIDDTQSVKELQKEGMSRDEALKEHNRQAMENKKFNEQILEDEYQRIMGNRQKAKDGSSSSTKPTPVSEDPTKDKPVTKVSGEDDIKAMIIEHEGIRYEPYKDSVGLWTIGVGHLIGDGKSLPDDMNRTFSEKEVMDMFEEDYAHHKKIASRTPGYDEANYAGKAAMIDLGFNMGQWWPKWPNTAKALKEGDFTSAARGLEDSKWYRQVGRRAPKIVALIESAGTTAPSGGDIASGSSGIDAGHSQQRKPKTPMIVNNISNNNKSLTVENNVVGRDKSKIDPSLRYT